MKSLSGEFKGLLRLRVGNHRVFFEETEVTVTVSATAEGLTWIQ